MNTDNLIIKHNELTAEEFIELWNSVWSAETCNTTRRLDKPLCLFGNYSVCMRTSVSE